MTMHEFFIDPFVQSVFLRNALAACVILAIGSTPLGFFLVLRRMGLVGDIMSHAILPGVAVAFLISGMAISSMTVAGLIAGVVVALLAVFLSRFTHLKEDAAFTLTYLISMAIGVVLLSLKGGDEELLHMLFGNMMEIKKEALWLMAGTSICTLLTVAAFYRSLLIECFDPDFLKSARRVPAGMIFFVLLVINLISAFQALGTLMALGLMLLPAIAAGFWTRSIDRTLPLSIVLAVVSSYAGLLLSHHLHFPAGPSVVLAAGVISLFSAAAGSRGSLRVYLNR
jgi:zinc/manganese transport system permease protein